ncbi:MAG: V-type ATP synthase subunit I [Oscillospiraceae bacterium]
MGIEKMSLVSVEGRTEQLDQSLMLCCESRNFQMNDSSEKNGPSAVAVQNPYTGAYEKLRSTASALGITLEFRNYDRIEMNTPEQFNAWAEEISSKADKLRRDHEEMLKSIEELRRTDSCVKHLLGLNVSFRDLFGMKYVKMRIGRLPADNLQKLDYYANRCIHFIPFEKNPDYVWGIYITPSDSCEFADSLMKSLYFERTLLPDYLDDDAQTTDKLLNQIIDDEEKLDKQIETRMNEFREQHSEELLAVMSKLKFLSECYELRSMALISAGRFSFSGYCPTRLAKKLTDALEKQPGVQTVEMPIKPKNASPDVPVMLRNNVLFRPFEMFVKMYGLPVYNGFDPTPYVAVTYCLMFGMMFGDVGQGLLVSLLGLVLTKFTKNGLAPIMTRIGLFSAAFGVVYGSVFGLETIITPFFHRENVWKMLGYKQQPENIFQVATTLLIVALCIGIILIMLSMLFNTILNFRKRNLGEALFSVNGVAGLVFYVSLVAAAGGMFMFGVNLFHPAYIICLIVLPLALIFFKHPLSNLVMGVKSTEKVSVGNFIIENFIELFEAALSFLSNTMSYLRIGGFVLSHAGMMLVVAQLAGTNVPGAEITASTVIIYIIGNIIVMAIEGLLVGIQVLRLEFYEIFNRFYDGSGKSFRPVEVSFGTDK